MGALTAFADWADFFAAQVGASATLAGLLFVGGSMSLRMILPARFLPLRALLALVGILIISFYFLLPAQTSSTAAWGVLVVGLLVWLGGIYVELRGWWTKGHAGHVLVAINLWAKRFPARTGLCLACGKR